MSTTRKGPRRYDHRLVQQVRDTGDVRLATRQGVPRSTAYGWLKRAPAVVAPGTSLEPTVSALRLRVVRLEKRVERLSAVLRLLLVLFRVAKPDLSRVRFAGLDKARLLRAVHRTRGVFGLRRALAYVGLSLSRFHAWARRGSGCLLEDQPSCPATSPQRLTPAEVMTMRRMAVDEDLKHVPTGRLALLAQRIGAVFASTSTWYRFVRERGWRRPRLRIHPHQPVEGIRRLRWCDLAGGQVTVPAASAKSRRDQSVPLPERLAEALAAYRPGDAVPSDAVIPPGAFPNGLTFDRDLADAGIPKRDAEDRIMDRHALRTTFVSWLAASGTHPRTAQALARHADVETTMQRYTDVRLLDHQAAVDRLPLPEGTHGERPPAKMRTWARRRKAKRA